MKSILISSFSFKSSKIVFLIMSFTLLAAVARGKTLEDGGLSFEPGR